MQALMPVQLDQLAEYHYRTWRILLDPKKTPVAEIFRPQFWVNATKIKVDDRIRVIASDKSFDFEITVTGKPESGAGLVVAVWPRFPEGVMSEAKALSDAAEVVQRELLASTVGGKAVPRIEHTEAEGWRVIDIKGDVHSRNHRSESAANVAMGKYLKQLGIDKVAEPAKAALAAQPVNAGLAT